MSQTLHPDTLLVHAGTERSHFLETSEALYLTQAHVYTSGESCEARFKGEEPGFVYARFANPTVKMFEERMAALEGAEAARATASGMAAVMAALLAPLRSGDHIVAPKALFGSCRIILEEILPRYGITATLVNGADIGAWERALRPETKMLFLESPANPTLDVVDIAGVAALGRSIGAKVVVDNVFATPLLQKPFTLGADCVVYSATKHIDGQGRCLGGVILASQAYIDEHLQSFLRHTGPALSPFNAWVMLKGLETLSLRVARQTGSAGILADWLANQPKISRLTYPGRADHPQADIVARQMSGGSTLVAFEVAGGKDAAFRLMNALKVILISNNLGDAKTLIAHPATSTHQRLADDIKRDMGITPALLRLSVGLEHAGDLIRDLDQALTEV
jgi:O-succinylhomoserine sulfhydrylase